MEIVFIVTRHSNAGSMDNSVKSVERKKKSWWKSAISSAYSRTWRFIGISRLWKPLTFVDWLTDGYDSHAAQPTIHDAPFFWDENDVKWAQKKVSVFLRPLNTHVKSPPAPNKITHSSAASFMSVSRLRRIGFFPRFPSGLANNKECYKKFFGWSWKVACTLYSRSAHHQKAFCVQRSKRSRHCFVSRPPGLTSKARTGGDFMGKCQRGPALKWYSDDFFAHNDD